LDANREQMERWREYINTQFDDIELTAQIAGHEAQDLIGSARQLGRERFLEPYFSARSPADRAVYEDILNGRINGGCQQCHSSNIAWQWNLRHPEFEHGPTTAQELEGLANYVTLLGPHRPGAIGQLPPSSVAAPAPQAGAVAPAAQGPAPAANPTTITAPPAALTYPTIQSDLCGDLPPQPVTPEPFNPAVWGPNTELAVSAIQRIHPVLDPLGPAGYRVLPQGVFSTLYNRTPAQLRALVMENIDERQAKYLRLKSLILAGQVDYKELCPIVAELLPLADPFVRSIVNFDIAQQRFIDTLLDILLAIVGAALILLSVVFPPAAFLALTLAFGLLQTVVGTRDLERGRLYDLGTGANVFSPEQEAAAPGLVVGGMLNIVFGVLTVATAAPGLSRLGRTPGAQLAPRGPSGRFNPLPDGSFIAFHPENPNIVIILEGDRLTAGIYLAGEFRPLATAPSPWPVGTPPPGTPTWAEWTAARGWATPGAAPSGTSGSQLALRPGGGPTAGPAGGPLGLSFPLLPGGGGRFFAPAEIDALLARGFGGEGPMVNIPAYRYGRPAHILEIGSGPERTFLGVPESPAVTIVRTDVVQTFPIDRILNAQDLLPGDLVGNFDTVIINNPRNYLPNLDQLGRALRPGGRIIIQGNLGRNPEFRTLVNNVRTPPNFRREVLPEEGSFIPRRDLPPEFSAQDPEAIRRNILGGPFRYTESSGAAPAPGATGPGPRPNYRVVFTRIR
jgi:hypothetical protein